MFRNILDEMILGNFSFLILIIGVAQLVVMIVTRGKKMDGKFKVGDTAIWMPTIRGVRYNVAHPHFGCAVTVLEVYKHTYTIRVPGAPEGQDIFMADIGDLH